MIWCGITDGAVVVTPPVHSTERIHHQDQKESRAPTIYTTEKGKSLTHLGVEVTLNPPIPIRSIKNIENCRCLGQSEAVGGRRRCLPQMRLSQPEDQKR